MKKKPTQKMKKIIFLIQKNKNKNTKLKEVMEKRNLMISFLIFESHLTFNPFLSLIFGSYLIKWEMLEEQQKTFRKV